ncbi:nucleotidyltransferase domain-containing protein [Bifidobacterium gallicum]|nr:nucleotidyltransferase domain-containing protein [Bifidobacterium gallicum]KFI58697.1 nucleotidyltransferase [Bifidobacterium gallicum DSM 20093 = LMG 11596]
MQQANTNTPTVDVEELFARMAQWPQVEAIALGGSRASGNNDARSDYDVYVYVNEPIPDEQRHELLEQYCSVLEIGNHYWEMEDNCTLNDGIDIDILYRDIDGFMDGVAQVVEHANPSNGYTTCMWHNVITSRTVFDRNGRLEQAKQRFDVAYPENLRRAVVERNMNLLSGTLPAYDHQIAKAASRGDTVNVINRVAAFLDSYFDALFALNRVTHPGEKRMRTLALRDCAALPEQFEENLDALVPAMHADADTLNAMVASMVTNMQRLVAQQMPEDAS